ncbi:hypothetical protein V1477_018488 [Vespula maculifrons]|uniref:Uncharacterized protein n=1 Tax=Vespula maculifrons TaxID=7453 RepID=A0ABD2AWE9_VESMC
MEKLEAGGSLEKLEEEEAKVGSAKAAATPYQPVAANNEKRSSRCCIAQDTGVPASRRRDVHPFGVSGSDGGGRSLHAPYSVTH